MSNNFITNNPQKTKTLEKRVKQLVSVSSELKFLVGFFFFSGWSKLFDSIKEKTAHDENFNIKLLVGLEIDKTLKGIIEAADNNEEYSNEEIVNNYFQSLYTAINNAELDVEEFYNQVEFFIELLEKERIILRKTYKPNHAKLYIFKLGGDAAVVTPSEFITGSSNLTRAGLTHQNEFNVEIRDYGIKEAEEYFDELWESAIKISEIPERRQYIIDFIKNRSQAATVTPFEAYVFVLKLYVELMEQKHIKPYVERLLEENNFKKYSYQIDAVNQALSIIEQYNGVIVADVVGLGKSVIASLLAKNLGKRGLVICPPALIGERRNKSGESTGWWEYLQRFKLHDWEVESSGKLEELSEYFNKNDDTPEVIIVDEAHRFRNQDTADYEFLQNICRNKIVLLLTATPFNNSPADIFSLLKLFIIPGKSGITLDDDLESRFASYNYLFKRLSNILKNYNSKEDEKRKKAENQYKSIFDIEPPIDIRRVKNETKRLAKEIKSVLEPILIRRNRLDLEADYLYSKEVTELSKVEDPEELFFELSTEQSLFYDRVINEYFGSEGKFTGAIYQPFVYEKKTFDEEKLGLEDNRTFLQQRNLYDFMRRLLVKRFESSFGAFYASIKRFKRVHKIVLEFIEKTDKYILDRKLIESIYENDADEIDKEIEKFAESLKDKNLPKHNKVYHVNKFSRKTDFITDIENDLKLLTEISNKIEKLDLLNNDPKREEVLHTIKKIIESEENPKRKVIVFTEYLDTLNSLKSYFKEHFGDQILFSEGSLTISFSHKLNENFNAQYQGSHKNQFQILFTSDKLSEGVNLNRAGTIINYDIPWNPTRVIQRVGRINRIGMKVFDQLFIYNFFPSEKGADIVKSREIAANKMFLIHNTLGEDSKIFDPDEEPTPSKLFNRINENPEEDEEQSTLTKIRNELNIIKTNHPETIKRISNFPYRIKSAKSFSQNELLVIRKKGLSLFVQKIEDENEDKPDINLITIDELIPSIKCDVDEPKLNLSEKFWQHYELMKKYKPAYKNTQSAQSIEFKSLTNLHSALKNYRTELEPHIQFIIDLIKDLKEYQTINKYSLRRLIKYELSKDASAEIVQKFSNEIISLKSQLGENYLEIIKEKTKQTKTEVIVADENIRNQLL
ncbi:MAG: DEAD/DEAH box helicase family protein [Ignavibacteriae bacterium]|nr:helicase [Ignavibacteriota bacterium]NOG99727.1 DEAD/DEAH box helicase family protein [Ignavibacteriota bacterium]